jgi:hypothetical protein
MERNTTVKKISRVLIFIALILGVGFWFSRPVPQSKIVSTKVITIVNAISYTDIEASTPFDALVLIAKKNNLDLQTKQYDFGVFVEGIGEQKNTKDMACGCG